MQVAALRRADCFDNDGRRRVDCEKCGCCCEIERRGSIREGRYHREDAYAATEFALHGSYLTVAC